MEKQLITDAQQFDEKRFTKINIIRNKHSVAFLLNFLPGQHMKSHNHPKRELYLYLIQGDGVFLIDGEELEVEKGDVIYCGKEEQIGFTNNGEENVSIYCTMTKLSD
ncbi:cupin domain-containing protein [Virgibacillus sp. NKC19-16]|uniref:cupin domain-containing protein n=1 Tax=Virgibacillus salidurans TaxID=2831673 RepID=UPI001F2F8383|nr:cupin domain-containing protein [Virgibacillus sp. NKC19-16]UJL46659.1 cupin domain-containing protein [Virgibacillus sp. NKC19-16]